MCFSATASFTASLGLLVISILTLKKASRTYRIVATIPLFFSLQQTAEGIVWVSEPGHVLHHVATYIFLSFALIVWPIWIPFTCAYLETNPLRKQLLRLITLLGLLWSIAVLGIFISNQPHASIASCHIVYTFNGYLPISRWLALGLYCIPTVVPFFVSSQKRIFHFGWLLLFFLAITVLVWRAFLISVWCFLAALISMLVYRSAR